MQKSPSKISLRHIFERRGWNKGRRKEVIAHRQRWIKKEIGVKTVKPPVRLEFDSKERSAPRSPLFFLLFFSLTIPQLKSIFTDNDCYRIGCGEFPFFFPSPSLFFFFFSFQMLPLVISFRGKASVKFDEDRIEQ